MSNFEFLLILLFCNSIILIGLVLRSIKKKSPRIILKFFFLPVIVSCVFGLFIQEVFQTRWAKVVEGQVDQVFWKG